MKARAWTLSLFLTAAGLAPAVGPTTPACAAEGGPRAALVVDTGKDVYELCVELNKPSVSGIDFIELAHEQHDLDRQYGYGGKAVCRLANVPKEEPSEECFEDRASFWGYWRADESGRWVWSGTGAAGSEVRDGDVEGWAYGTGRDGDTHQQPGPEGKRVSFDAICPEIEQPDPEKDDEKKPKEGKAPGPGVTNLPDDGKKPVDKKTPGPAPSVAPEPDERRINSAPEISELAFAPTTPSPSPPPSELPPEATTASSEAENQLPLAGALALLATVAMAAIAVLLLRKRAPAPPEE